MNILNLDFSNFDETHIATEEEFLSSCFKFVELTRIGLETLSDEERSKHLMKVGACMLNNLSFSYKLSYADCVIFSAWIRLFVETQFKVSDTIKKDDLQKTIEQLEKSYYAMPKLPEQENKEGN